MLCATLMSAEEREFLVGLFAFAFECELSVRLLFSTWLLSAIACFAWYCTCRNQ